MRRLPTALLLTSLLGGWTAGADDLADPQAARGEYLLRAAGCVACHTDSEHKGRFLAGGRAFVTPQGTFYSPNITPDPDHGIGHWSEQDLARALTKGIGPAGHRYYPLFPYTSYTRMRAEDISALKAYLDTVPPVARENREHDLPWYLPRFAISLWQWLYFRPGTFVADPARDDRWNRGAYLVRALAHCAECHSPRNDLGGIDEALQMAGTRHGPDGESVPNITPDKETGIGRWSDADLAYYLKTGADPDGDYAGGLMSEVIDEGLSHLSDEDITSIVSYLKALPPIHHLVVDE